MIMTNTATQCVKRLPQNSGSIQTTVTKLCCKFTTHQIMLHVYYGCGIRKQDPHFRTINDDEASDCETTAVAGIKFSIVKLYIGRSQWPRGLRRGSAAIRLLGLWVRMPQGTWMSVSCECCVLSGRRLCVGLITRPEESYRL